MCRVLSLSIALLVLMPWVAHAERWTFAVYLDEKRIGQHHFEIEREHADSTIRVTSKAHFDVKVLMVPVFRYRHTAEEIWRDGCLDAISTRTQVNGKRYAVDGRRTTDAFEMETAADGQSRRHVLPACIASYAYWDPDTLSRHGQLLNGQTGDYQRVEQRLLADESIGSALLELSGTDFRIDLHYRHTDGRWQALRTTTGDGRRLDYRLEEAASVSL